MSKLSDFAAYCTSAQSSSFTALDGNSRLNVVKDFYNSKGLELPGTITITSTTKVSRLTKDERNAVSYSYAIAVAKGETPSEEMLNNLLALSDPEKSITTTKSAPYKESIKEFGASVVAAKLIDALSVSDNDEFHKIRKFDVPASVDISEIPAFINELAQIYANSTGNVIAIDPDGLKVIKVKSETK